MVWVTLAIAAVSVASSVLAPRPKDDTQPLAPPTVPDSALNAVLPTVLGKGKVGGKFVYSTPPRLVEGRVSGKGAAPKKEQDSYFVDALVYMFAINEPCDLKQLYLNGSLLFEPDTLDVATVAFSEQYLEDHLTIFPGDDLQQPSALLETFSGVGEIPAFKNVMYIVLRDINLGDYGNGYPQVVATLESKASYPNGKAFLDRVLELSEVNVDSLEAFGVSVVTIDESVASIPFQGAVFENSGNGLLNFIQPYVELYQLVIEETTDGVYNLTKPFDISAVTETVVTIDVAQILGENGKDKYQLSDQSKDEIPSSVSLDYIDPLREFDPNSVTVYNTKPFKSNDINANVNVALSKTEAYSGAERLMRAAWSKKKKLTFKLPVNFDAQLRVGAQVRFLNDDLLEGLSWTVVEESFSTKFFIEYTCVQLNRMLYAYSKSVTSSTFIRNNNQDTIGTQNALRANILDIPLISNTEGVRDGVYVAVEVPATAAVDYIVYASYDNGLTYSVLGTTNQLTKTGSLLNPLPVSDYHIPDENNSIFVQLNDTTKSLASVTQTEFEQCAQLMVIGKEIISYRDAVDQGNGIYEISGLIRGSLTTEAETSAYATNSAVSFIKGDLTNRPRFPVPVSEAGNILFKVVLASNDNFDSVPDSPVLFSNNSAKSPSPIIDAPDLQVNGDWILRYTDRTYGDTAKILIDNLPRPTNPDGSTFEIELFDDGVLIKSVFTSGNAYVYTPVDQVTDTGSLVTNLTYCVYQIRDNSFVGRGHKSLELTNDAL